MPTSSETSWSAGTGLPRGGRYVWLTCSMTICGRFSSALSRTACSRGQFAKRCRAGLVQSMAEAGGRCRYGAVIRQSALAQQPVERDLADIGNRQRPLAIHRAHDHLTAYTLWHASAQVLHAAPQALHSATSGNFSHSFWQETQMSATAFANAGTWVELTAASVCRALQAATS